MAQESNRPLADRIRPEALDAFIGQRHLVGEGKPLRLAITTGNVPSMILWGPPGVGKTTLARIIARQTGYRFYALSAVAAGKADVRAVVDQARAHDAADMGPLFGASTPAPDAPRTLLFLDEIHRFNKAQQDYLLPYVEDGTLVLIGATTENPSFEVIAALLSRLQVFTLNALTEDEIVQIIARGQQELGVALDEEALAFLAGFANGDARFALNLLENATRLYGTDAPLTLDRLRETLQTRHLRYDKTGEEHYNTISAFIKSLRASDPDAALYYLARMVHSGEDPLFIARRMVIFASEDIGMANPTALVVANAVFDACARIGLPECQYNLAHGVLHLALARKGRAADAYWDALADVEQYGNLPIPLALRNAPTSLMRRLGYGEGYSAYGPESRLPEALQGKRYYQPPATDEE
jgi:putative ATPase